MFKAQRDRKQRLLVATVSAAVLLNASQFVLAEDSDKIEEVLITARLIEENLQDVPMSVAAFSEQMIDERGLDNLTEIARTTPNFSFENFNGAFGVPVIRGQSQNRLTNPVQNVATFYNGVYLQRGYMIDASLLNIGQIEVLRGPQAAAFGRNAYAGALNFKSKEIGEEVTAKVAISAGENEYERLDLTAELPLSPEFGLILGYSDSEYDGGWKNNHALANTSDPAARTTGNLGGYDSTTYNVGFRLSPSDTFTLKANYLSSEIDLENNPSHVITGAYLFATNNLNCSGGGGAPTLWCGTLPVNPVIPAGSARKDGLVIDPRTGLTMESDILSVDAQVDFSENLRVNFIYGHTEGSLNGAGASVYDHEAGYDFGFPGALLIDTSGNGSIEADSYELRATWKANENLSGYGGIFYSESDDLTKFALINVPAQTVGPLDPGVELNFPGFAANSLNAREITSVFGFVNYEMGQWVLSAEGRYTWEDITETDNTAGTSAGKDYGYFTPRLSASYHLNENSSLYASYSTGLKAGGFNSGGSNPAGFQDPSQATYDEEENTTYEIGSRNILLDGALTLNATLFFIDAKDLQVNVPKLGANGSVISNRSEAETLGFEIESIYDATESLQLFGGIGYVDAEYGNVLDSSAARRCDDIVCPTNGDISGNQLERAPSLTINAGFDYRGTLTGDVDYYINGSVGYQDEQYSSARNVAKIESRTITDVAFGLTYGKFEAKLSVDNLFDEEYVASTFEIDFLNTYSLNLGDRRKAVLRLSYTY